MWKQIFLLLFAVWSFYIIYIYCIYIVFVYIYIYIYILKATKTFLFFLDLQNKTKPNWWNKIRQSAKIHFCINNLVNNKLSSGRDKFSWMRYISEIHFAEYSYFLQNTGTFWFLTDWNSFIKWRSYIFPDIEFIIKYRFLNLKFSKIQFLHFVRD